MRGAALLAALLAAVPALAAEEPIDCPPGTHRVSTDDPYAPFRCAGADEAKKGFDSVLVPNGFKMKPRCPRGTHPAAETGSSLQAYRCVRSSSGDPDPELAPIRGDGEPGAPPSSAPRGGSSQRYSIPGQIAFDYPSAFRVQDAWNEDVPTLYLKIDDASVGKPVTITITRYAASQSSYQGMDEAIRRDVEWQGAKDAGTAIVAGARARATDLPGDTRSVYLPASKESYYSFVYSAPAGSYERYLPSFTRLLKSLKLPGKAP